MRHAAARERVHPLKPRYYGGALQSFNITSIARSHLDVREFSYTTKSLQLSLAPLPPPLIISWYAPGTLAHSRAVACDPLT